MNDTETPAVPAAPAAPAAPAPSWRKRHPVVARLVLYGLGAAVLAGGAWWAFRYRRESSRQALILRLDGLDQTGFPRLKSEETIRILREEVLPASTDGDVTRRAHLMEAEALDQLRRFDEAEAVYTAVDAAMPPEIPRGPVRVPWANMRIRAGRAKQALELLDAPFSTNGWPVAGPDSAAAVHARAEAAMKASPPSPATVPTR